eukprot:1843970-Alexandrium_andersonii.AAC.1
MRGQACEAPKGEWALDAPCNDRQSDPVPRWRRQAPLGVDDDLHAVAQGDLPRATTQFGWTPDLGGGSP